MKKGIRYTIVLAVAAAGFALAGCGNTTTVTPAEIGAMTPAQLQAYAASMTPAQLQALAAALTPAQMPSIVASLSPAQLQALAPYLAAATGGSGGTVTPPDGAALYTADCAGCHGPIATSAKLGATAARIQGAIIGNIGGMGAFAATLTAADVQAIATALAGAGTGTGTATTPPDGAALFSTYCASCHGSMGGTSLSSIQSAIRGESRMNSLSSLTPSQLQAIADYLSTQGGRGESDD